MRRMRFAIALLTAAGLALPSLAAAQDSEGPPGSRLQTGSRMQQQVESLESGKLRALQKDIVRCMAYRDKDLSRLVVTNSDMLTIDFKALPESDEDLIDQLDMDDCIGRAMKQSQYSMRVAISYQLLRNLLVEEVYLMDNKAPPTVTAASLQSLDNRSFAASGSHPAALAMAKLADCIGFHAGAEADALLRTRPGSKDEQEALQAVLPKLSNCADLGEDAKVNVAMVRTLAGDGLLMRALHSAGAGAPVASAAPES